MTPVEHQYRFVLQFHRSRRPHYDFRLERDGVYKSWALPKGVPQEVGIRRLAIQVEDHDLDFGDFEGDIPEGDYGAGYIEIWDRGTYELHEWSDERVVLTLHGKRLDGTYNLIRFHRGGEWDWLMFKLDKPVTSGSRKVRAFTAWEGT